MGGFIFILLFGIIAIFAAGGGLIDVIVWWGVMLLFVYWIYRKCVKYDERKNKEYAKQQAKIEETRKRREAEKRELISRMNELDKRKTEIIIEKGEFLDKIKKLSGTENEISSQEFDEFFENKDKELKRIFDERWELYQKLILL